MILLSVGNEVSKIGGGSPGLHDSPQAYAAAVGTPAGLLAGSALVVLGLFLFMPFCVALTQTLRRAGDSHVASTLLLGGGLLTVTAGLLGVAPVAAAGVLAQDGDLDAELAKALTLMNGSSFILMWATTSILVGAASAMALRSGRLPAVLGWSGALLAPALLAGSVVVWIYQAAFAVWMLTMLWLIATSVVLALRPGGPRAVAENANSSAPPTASLILGDER